MITIIRRRSNGRVSPKKAGAKDCGRIASKEAGISERRLGIPRTSSPGLLPLLKKVFDTGYLSPGPQAQRRRQRIVDLQGRARMGDDEGGHRRRGRGFVFFPQPLPDQNSSLPFPSTSFSFLWRAPRMKPGTTTRGNCGWSLVSHLKFHATTAHHSAPGDPLAHPLAWTRRAKDQGDDEAGPLPPVSDPAAEGRRRRDRAVRPGDDVANAVSPSSALPLSSFPEFAPFLSSIPSRSLVRGRREAHSHWDTLTKTRPGLSCSAWRCRPVPCQRGVPDHLGCWQDDPPADGGRRGRKKVAIEEAAADRAASSERPEGKDNSPPRESFKSIMKTATAAPGQG